MIGHRSDGVAIDWEIPGDDVDETEMRDNAISRPVQHEIIELDDFMEAGVELLPNPAGTDAAVGAEPMQSAEPIGEVRIQLLFLIFLTLSRELCIQRGLHL